VTRDPQPADPPMTEADLRAIAERAYNPLIPMAHDARHDIKALLRYVKSLREQVNTLDAELTGARATVMVVCKRAPDLTLRIPDVDIVDLHPKDVLRCDDVTDHTSGEVTKVFRYEPYPRIVN
jgi:hypothetical protein